MINQQNRLDQVLVHFMIILANTRYLAKTYESIKDHNKVTMRL